MKKLILFLLLINFLTFADKNAKPVQVFYLGGQSNMEGYGYNSDLPDTLNKQLNDVWIFHGNSVGDNQNNGGIGKWEILKPGHGTGFSFSNNKNKLSKRFGVELSFAKKLRKVFPGEKIALIKYSKGGSALDSMAAGQFGSWEPDFSGTNGLNQYDNFLNTINNAFAIKDIDNDGIEDLLIPSGIIWMQGESDAYYSEKTAASYYTNLKRLMDLIRASLRKDDLPVVIGKISDSWNDEDGKVWDYCELVQYAQEKYAKTDKNAAIVRSTRYYKYCDPWHYTSDAYIDLGNKFAEELIRLMEKNRTCPK